MSRCFDPDMTFLETFSTFIDFLLSHWKSGCFRAATCLCVWTDWRPYLQHLVKRMLLKIHCGNVSIYLFCQLCCNLVLAAIAFLFLLLPQEECPLLLWRVESRILRLERVRAFLPKIKELLKP
jgi:hypothetical protein